LNKAAQARAGIIKMIAEDPTIITIERYPLGGLYPSEDLVPSNDLVPFDSDGPVSFKYRVSISPEKSTPLTPSDSPVSVNNRSFMKHLMLIDYHGGPLQNEIFSTVNKQTGLTEYYIVGRVEQLFLDGEIIGYQANRLDELQDIRNGGKQLVFTIPGDSTGWSYYNNPITGQESWTKDGTTVYVDPATASTTINVYALELEYSEKDIDGTLILRGDRKFMLSIFDSDGNKITKPSVDKTFTIGRTTLKIVNVSPFQPGPQVVYYIIQARA